MYQDLSSGGNFATASDLLRSHLFPNEWKFRPVRGKRPMSNAWQTHAYAAEESVQAFDKGFERKDGSFGAFDGHAVMTGAKSGGLLALDIDGSVADDAYLGLAGEAYEPMGEESTMAFTSGRVGRRQLLYKVPGWLVPSLQSLTVHKLRDDQDGLGELSLRFNSCYTVLPGSKHPDTGKQYRFTRDADIPGAADAPEWILEILLELRTAPRFLEPEELEALAVDSQPGAIPDRQLRGWFWKAEIQSLLGAKLTEVVYDHPNFGEWNDSNPRRAANFCPFHGGDSGDSFHVDFTGEQGYGWHCKVCGTGGNPLQFLHAVEEADPFASMPQGADLRRVIEQVAVGLGFNYPEDLQAVQLTREITAAKPARKDLLTAASEILRTVRNPAEQTIALYDLAEESGRSRMTARDLKYLAVRDAFYRDKDANLVRPNTWFEDVENEEFIIPGLLRTGSQVMIHARGGVGKSETMLALAKAVGRGSEMVVRGMKIKCRQGPVVWISSDQSLGRLKASMLLQEIDPIKSDPWFHLVTDWKADLLHDFQEIINTIEPVLVVVDSLGSVQDGTDCAENEGNYAAALYQLATLNGDLGKQLGFKSCCIAWIHHNTKSGEDFRGTDRLKNALDETWSLKEATEEEELQYGTNKRILTIGKSRYGRGGDRLLVSRDLEFNYEISDMTPIVTREGVNRAGRQTPETLVLEILAASSGGLTRKELHVRLNQRLTGERGDSFKAISDYGVRKYLSIWVDAGLVTKARRGQEGSQGGRPSDLWMACGPRAVLPSREAEDAERMEILRRGFETSTNELTCDGGEIGQGVAGGSPSSHKQTSLGSNPFPENESEGAEVCATDRINPSFHINPSPEQGSEEVPGEVYAKNAPEEVCATAQINPHTNPESVVASDLGDEEVSAQEEECLRAQARTRARESEIDLSGTQEALQGVLEGGEGQISPEGCDRGSSRFAEPREDDDTPEGPELGDFSRAWL